MDDALELEALADRADRFLAEGRALDALDAFSEIVRRCGGSNSPFEAELAAWAGVQQGHVTRDELGGDAAARPVFEAVAERYGDHEHPSVRKQVALALSARAAIIGRTRRSAEALQSYEDVIVAARRGPATQPASWGLEYWGAKAKARELARQARYKDAVATLDELLDRLRWCDKPDVGQWRSDARREASTIKLMSRLHPLTPIAQRINRGLYPVVHPMATMITRAWQQLR